MKKLPRFQPLSGATGRGKTDRLVRPLAPVLARLVDDTDQARAHADVAGRYSEMRTRVQALREELVRVRRRDAEKERAALAAGKPVAKPSAPKVEDELREAERQLAVLDELVVEYADGLLAVAVKELPAAIEQAEQTVEAALDAVGAKIDEALDALEAANAATAERGWVAMLSKSGVVYPFAAGGTQALPTAREALARARLSFKEDMRLRAEHLADREREKEFGYAQKHPEGQEVWMNGRSYRADGKGGLVEVER